QASTEGQTVSLALAATDNSGTNSLTYVVTGLPTGLTANPTTGLVTGTLGYRIASLGATTTFTPTVTLTDNHSGTDSLAMVWTVADRRLVSLSFWTGHEGDSVSLGSPSGLTWAASGLPGGVGLNATNGLVSGVLAYNLASAGGTATLTSTVTYSD